MKKRLFVGNLAGNVNERELRERFERFGHVENVEFHTKKDETGKPFRTFAYLDMGLTQEKLVNCIKAYHDTTWNGNKIVVQVAKESYIQRIRREAERFKVTATNEAWKKNADTNSWNKSTLLHKVKVEDTEDDNKVELLGAWTRKDAKRLSIGGDASSASKRNAVSSSPDEFTQQKAFLFDELSDDRANKPTIYNNRRVAASYFEPHSAFPGVASVAPKHRQLDSHKFKEDKEIHEQQYKKKAYIDVQTRRQMDNEKRLMSLKAKAAQSKSQHELLRSAFSSLDTGGLQGNKKIVFTDSEEEGSENGEAAPSHVGKRHILFDDDGEGDDAGDLDKVEEDFRVRPQFEGKKGHKVWQLQSRIGTDERFRLNERFVESDEDSNESTHDDIANMEVTGEKERNLKILQDVVGRNVLEDTKLARKKAVFRDTEKLRFDPTRADSSRFEIKKEPTAVSKKKKKKEVPPTELPPEVSSQQFYEVSAALQNALGSRSKTEEKPFSFSHMFGHGDGDDDGADPFVDSDLDEGAEEEKYRSKVETVKKTKTMLNPFEKTPFQHDSSDDEGKGVQGDPGRQAKDDDEAHKDSRFLVQVQRPRFFFLPGDNRLLEGVEFFRRHGDRETITQKWAAMKEKVYPAMMCKRKLARRAAERKYGKKGAWKATQRK